MSEPQIPQLHWSTRVLAQGMLNINMAKTCLYRRSSIISRRKSVIHLDQTEKRGEGIKIADKLYIGKKRCKIFSISNTNIQQYTRSVNERVNAIESLFLIAKSNNTTEFAQVIGEYARLRDFRCKDERIVWSRHNLIKCMDTWKAAFVDAFSQACNTQIELQRE